MFEFEIGKIEVRPIPSLYRIPITIDYMQVTKSELCVG
jgi:hypothetical protein